MRFTISYRVYNEAAPLAPYTAAVNGVDVVGGLDDLSIEAKSNGGSQYDVSATSKVAVGGLLASTILAELLFSPLSQTNAIECRLYDTICDKWVRGNYYIKANSLPDLFCEKDGSCFEVTLKYIDMKQKQVSITTIDTDQLKNPKAYYPNFGNLPHPRLPYCKDVSFMYWALIFAILVAVVASFATIGTFFLIPITGAAITALAIASLVLIFTIIVSITAGDFFAEARGCNREVVSPYIKTYIKNLQLSNALPLLFDSVVTNPTKILGLSNACFFYTNGLILEGTTNTEFSKLNWSGEDFLNWINKRFGAKWRVLEDRMIIKHKDEPFNVFAFDFTDFSPCLISDFDTPYAAANYALKKDGQDTQGNKAYLAMSDIVSFTNNLETPAQNGMLAVNFDDAPTRFRNDGLDEDKLTAVDNFFTGVSFTSGLFNIFFSALNLDADDEDFILISAQGGVRMTETPKLIFEDPAVPNRAIKKDFTVAIIDELVNQGYQSTHMVQPSSKHYNWTAYCDENLNTIEGNCFQLMNDDPRINCIGREQKITIPVCCDYLVALGFLEDPTNEGYGFAIDCDVQVRKFGTMTTETQQVQTFLIDFEKNEIEIVTQKTYC